MAKIRGVKPDFWTDEAIVELSFPARLLYIGMWNYACDNGHLEDRPKQIKMRILPADAVNAEELLSELSTSGRIARADGWITIPNLSDHQKPNKRYWLTCEKEGCAAPGDTDEQRRKGGEQARAKLGKVGHPLDGDGDGDGDGEGDAREDAPPPPHCSKHPNGTDQPCVACGRARRKREEWDIQNTAQLKAAGKQWAQWARGQPNCPHGQPGGDIDRPRIGTPACALCRSERKATA